MRHPVTWTGEGGVLRAQERSKRTNEPRVAKQAGRARGTARAPRTGHRRQRRTTRGVQAAFVGGDATGALVGSADAWQWLGTRLTIAAAAFAVYYIFFVPVERADRRGDNDCPRCGGTGVVECMCTRWSDGDVGCKSCNWTGWAPCNNCGGGGLKRPLAADLYARADDDSNSGG